jgi:hypothetical protein
MMEAQVFAFNKLFLGDSSVGGVVSRTAWRSYGYDLDGKVTAKDSTDVCTSRAGASAEMRVDGDGGIDNSFGANVLPMLAPFGLSSRRESQRLADGAYTYLLAIVGLAADPAQTNLAVPGSWLQGATFPGTPTFTLAESWPVTAGSLVDGSLAGGAKVTFRDAYVVGGTWVSSGSSDVVLHVDTGGADLSLAIHHAVVTFQHPSPTRAARGVIAGVLDPEALVEAIRQISGRSAPSLCTGSAWDSIAAQIRQAADILLDGSNAAGKPCDGISIGIGFEAEQIGPLTRVVADGPAPPRPCR